MVPTIVMARTRPDGALEVYDLNEWARRFNESHRLHPPKKERPR